MPAKAVRLIGLFIAACLPQISHGQRVVNDTLMLPTELPTGSYELEDVFWMGGSIAFKAPPGEINQLYVATLSGQVNVFSDLANLTLEQTPFLDLSGVVTTDGENGLLGLAFHPQYHINRQFFVFYTAERPGGIRTNRLSRFLHSEDDPLLADPGSEVILIDQVDEANNHNAGDIDFGPDGYLYVSLGDEGGAGDLTNPQRVDQDFFSGILRIDVDKRPGNIEPTSHPDVMTDGSGDAYYSVPVDNPLVTRWQNSGSDPDSDLRLEFYAIGLRNPWRMDFDPATGRLWVGDVGADLVEEVDVVERGGNYGWAIREGDIAGPYDQQQTPPEGFETLSEPIYTYGRDLGSSTTGGVVYRGSALPELEGAYIFGDFVSGRVWALFEGANGEAPTVQQIASYPFHYSYGRHPATGDVLIGGSAGAVSRVVRGEGASISFPETLSATGAFQNLNTLEPEAGILPYTPNLSFWSDYAIKSRWVSVAEGTIGYQQDDAWNFPEGSIWIKHFELELERGNPSTRTRIETRFLVKTANGIYGLAYKWNEAQTDATLVAEDGENIEYAVIDNGQEHTQTWRIPGRQECLQCHTGNAGYALSFNTRQLNRDQLISGQNQNLLSYLSDNGYLDTDLSDLESLPKHYEAEDESVSLETRVRSYLEVNCVSCHSPGGGAPNSWDARASLSLEETGLINGVVGDNQGNSDRRLIVRNSPELSVLLSRVNASDGYTRMPPVGTNELDHGASSLLTAWINESASTSPEYIAWQIANFGSVSAPNAGPLVDADLDGNSNILEFLNRTDPLDPSEVWRPVIEKTATEACVQFPMSSNRQYEVEVSSNLVDWETWLVPGNPPAVNATQDTQADLKGDLPDSPTDVFLRVKVSDE